MRKLITLVSCAAVGATLLFSGVFAGSGTFTNTVGGGKATTRLANTYPPASSTPQDPPGTIEGSVTPHLIPDSMAYELFFNFFSNRTESERGKLQAYCNQTALANVNLDSILAAAAYYQQLVAPINAQAEAIRDNSPHATATDAALINAQLASLQVQRETILNSCVAKLTEFVGPEGAVAIRQHIDGRIKRLTKIVPGPTMPINGIMPGASEAASMKHH